MRAYDKAQAVNIHLMILFFVALHATGQEKREQTFSVSPGALIIVTNNNGSIFLGPSGTPQVLVTTTSRANAVKLESEQHGNRINLRSVATSNIPGGTLVEYRVLVPVDTFVRLQSLNGLIRTQGLHGDIVMESISGPVDVNDMSEAHVHVKTLTGPIALTSIHHCHLDISSVSGDISLRNVAESSVVVSSGTGRITYDGDPGALGDYRLTSHSGDLTVIIPAQARVQITQRSRNAEPPIPNTSAELASTGRKSLLMPGISTGSRFVLRSFRGKIYLKRP